MTGTPKVALACQAFCSRRALTTAGQEAAPHLPPVGCVLQVTSSISLESRNPTGIESNRVSTPSVGQLGGETARPEPGRQELLQEDAVLILVWSLRFVGSWVGDPGPSEAACSVSARALGEAPVRVPRSGASWAWQYHEGLGQDLRWVSLWLALWPPLGMVFRSPIWAAVLELRVSS